MLRDTCYAFPETTLDAGKGSEVVVDLKNPFRASKLCMVGHMDEVRGHFKIRHSRLPLLNRENVIAYSNVTRIKAKRRTTVEYREHDKGNFVRSYLPENVRYVHTDPLSYINLLQLKVGAMPALPPSSHLPAVAFGNGALGNGLPFADEFDDHRHPSGEQGRHPGSRAGSDLRGGTGSKNVIRILQEVRNGSGDFCFIQCQVCFGERWGGRTAGDLDNVAGFPHKGNCPSGLHAAVAEAAATYREAEKTYEASHDEKWRRGVHEAVEKSRVALSRLDEARSTLDALLG